MNLPNGKREWLAITPAEYHELDAWGSGALRAFIKDGPLEFYDAYVSGTAEPKKSDALTLGTDFHLGVQYQDFAERFRLLPECIEDDDCFRAVNGTLKGNAKKLEAGQPIDTEYVAHRRYLEAHRDIARADGVQCIDGRVSGMIASCWDSPVIAELLATEHAKHEEACIYRHPSGVRLKALCDFLTPTRIHDFKSTRHSRPDDFLYDAFKKHGYQWQAGLYCLVTGIHEFSFISVRSAPSYEANLFTVPDRLLKELIETTEKHVIQLASFLRLADSDWRDSQGVPASFHSDGWGTELEFSEHGAFGDRLPKLTGYEEHVA